MSSVIRDLSNINITLNNEVERLLYEAIEETSKLEGFAKGKLDGLSNLLFYIESLASVKIEHYNSSIRELAAAKLKPTKDMETDIANHYLNSLSLSLDNPSVLEKEEIIKINSSLMNDEKAKIRDRINWIGVRGSIPHTAIFVPPHPEHLEKNIDEFVLFCKRDDIHPLVQIAFAYAYFETIHPFLDGNGRTGRIIVQRILKEKGYFDELIIPFSIGLFNDRRKHIKSLNQFREGDYLNVVKLFLEIALELVPDIYRLLDELLKIKEKWINKISARSDALVWDIIDELIKRPVISVNYIKDKYNANDQAVRNNFKILEEVNIISKMDNSRRNVLFEAREIIKVIEGNTLNALISSS